VGDVCVCVRAGGRAGGVDVKGSHGLSLPSGSLTPMHPNGYRHSSSRSLVAIHPPPPALLPLSHARVSRSTREMLAKASVVRHKHFWGHHEISLASTLRDRRRQRPLTQPLPARPLPHLPYQGGKGSGVEGGAGGGEASAQGGGNAGCEKIVFLDRDGVINTLASYKAGPAAMVLVRACVGEW